MKPKISPDMTERQKIVEYYRTAFNRAYNEHMVVYRHIDPVTGHWDLTADVPSASTGEMYRVTGLGGTDWADLGCTCPGSNHPACKHRALAAFAYKNGVWAVRNGAQCLDCHELFCSGGCPDAPPPFVFSQASQDVYRQLEHRLTSARERGDEADATRTEARLDALDAVKDPEIIECRRQTAAAKQTAEADHDFRVARIHAGALTKQQAKHQATVAEENRKFRIKQIEAHNKAMESGPYAAAVRKDPLADF